MRLPGFEPGFPAISTLGWEAGVIDQATRQPSKIWTGCWLWTTAAVGPTWTYISKPYQLHPPRNKTSDDTRRVSAKLTERRFASPSGIEGSVALFRFSNDSLKFQGQLIAALRLITIVQQQDRTDFQRLLGQAQFLIKARRYQEAIDLALKAVALLPEDPRPYAQVAYALAWQKRPEASEWALKAIARQPENVHWRVALSDSYTLRGKWKQALKPMSEAVTMDPLNPRLHSMLGLILVHCRRPAEGVGYLKRSLELDPTSALTHQRMSLALSKQFGKNKLAEEYLRKALELQPDNPVIKNQLGWRLLGLGRRQDAQEAFQEALRVDPTQGASKLGLGAPAGIRKGPSDIILRGAMRFYSIPHRIILAPACAVLAIEIPWLVLSDGGSLLVKGVSLGIAALSWCYIFSLAYVRVIAKKRGVPFV